MGYIGIRGGVVSIALGCVASQHNDCLVWLVLKNENHGQYVGLPMSFYLIEALVILII